MNAIIPDAYLLFAEDPDNAAKKRKFVQHMEIAPIGAKVPFTLDVQWVDSSGNATKKGSISGTIETLIEVEGEETIAVFSTGERISLQTFSA